MGFDIHGNISDVLCAERGSESSNAVFAVGLLEGDGCLAFVVVRDVSLEIVLLMSALIVNDVVSSNHVFWVRHLVPEEGQPMDSKKMILQFFKR